MKAVVLYAHGGNDQLKLEANFPDPKIGEGDVLIRLRATSLNYHDIFDRRGMPGIKTEFPFIPGMDFAGDIAEIGPGVPGDAGLKIGDRVLVNPSGRIADGNKKDHGHGGLAEYFRARWHQLIVLPEGVSYAEAASLPVAYGTASRLLRAVGQVQPCEKIYIIGASGGVGVGAVQIAKDLGAYVIAGTSSVEKGKRLLELGADEYINYFEEPLDEAIFKRFGKPSARNRGSAEGGVDVVVNYTGGETWVPSLRTLKRGGRLLTCGATAGFDPKEDIRHIWSFERKILGSGGWRLEDLEYLFGLLQQKKLVVPIHATLPLEESAEAFRIIEDREVFGKVIVAP
jgi:alcohol dehydrogenase